MVLWFLENEQNSWLVELFHCTILPWFTVDELFTTIAEFIASKYCNNYEKYFYNGIPKRVIE